MIRLVIGFLSVLTNCKMADVIGMSGSGDKAVEIRLTPSDESFLQTTNSFSLFTISPTVYPIPSILPTTNIPKETPIRSQEVHLMSPIVSTSLYTWSNHPDDAYTAGNSRQMHSPSFSFASGPTRDYVTHSSSSPTPISSVGTEFVTSSKTFFFRESGTSTDDMMSTMNVNTRLTPSLPFTPLTQSVGMYDSVKITSVSNSDRPTTSGIDFTITPTLATSLYVSSSSVSTSPMPSNSYLSLPTSQNMATLSDQFTNYNYSLNTGTNNTLESLTTVESVYSVEDSPNVVDSNENDSIYPFTFTFTYDSTSSLIFVMPAIVCVVLGIMLFTVFKRWHYYCKLKKYKLRSSNTTESVLSEASASPPLPASTTDRPMENSRSNPSEQKMTAQTRASLQQSKRAANTIGRATPDRITMLRRYRPGLEYFNKGFQYSPDCPIHGRRTLQKSSTQAVIEVV
ncbi:uncharacterized protein [Antedon mediterranea]|uniref:uncharacterized protein n=1 Tax=Antedon mediterranea TaxID=105859 RepID=UPI003AF68B6C